VLVVLGVVLVVVRDEGRGKRRGKEGFDTGHRSGSGRLVCTLAPFLGDFITLY
jgi:hypothetical protein